MSAPARPKDLVEKRRPLSRAEFAHLMVEQKGICGCGCRQKLQPLTEGVIDEHVIALELTGSNDLRNRSIWRKPCSTEKTKRDKAAIAKAKRLAGETCTAPPARPLCSRGFGDLTRKFDGSVSPKRAGRRTMEHADG